MNNRDLHIQIRAKFYWRIPSVSAEERIQRQQENIELEKIANRISIAVKNIIESVWEYRI